MTFKTHDIWEYFTGRPYHFTSTNENKLRARVRLAGSEVPDFLGELAELDVADLTEFPFSLEDYFMKFYKEDKVFEGVRQ